jgi:aryl-alcohol dehydrogenase-like predicted oxidoreductase
MFAPVMGNAPEDSARIIGKALDAGINLIDTADAYGDSEDVVGKALQGRRDEVVLATKFGRPIGQDPNHQGASGRWIVTAVENSLRRLRTDYIDLYQLHRPDPRTDIEETLSALTDLIRSGKVRAIGASQTPASGIVEARWVAERRGLARFHTSMALLHPQPRHRARSCPSPSATGWACWCGFPSRRECSPAASARASRPTCAAPPGSPASATSPGSTPSSRSSRSPRRRGCR